MTRFLACFLVAHVALIGCSDDSGTGGTGGSAGTGGTSGTGGSAGQPTNTCLEDLEILGDIEDVVSLITENCVQGTPDCAFQEVIPCIAECLFQDIGLARACGMCVGETLDCTLQACIADCGEPRSMECETCVLGAARMCEVVFERCAAGLPPS